VGTGEKNRRRRLVLINAIRLRKGITAGKKKQERGARSQVWSREFKTDLKWKGIQTYYLQEGKGETCTKKGKSDKAESQSVLGRRRKKKRRRSSWDSSAAMRYYYGNGEGWVGEFHA